MDAGNLAMIFFCLAIAAEGIGVAIYEIVKEKKQKKEK